MKPGEWSRWTNHQRWSFAAGVLAFVGLLIVGIAFLAPDVYGDLPPGKDPSVWDRAFTSRFLLLFRYGLLGVGSFVGGVIVHRVVAGDFAIKAGPVELTRADVQESVDDLADATEATAEAVAGLKAETDRIADRIAENSDRTQQQIATLWVLTDVGAATTEQKINGTAADIMAELESLRAELTALRTQVNLLDPGASS